MIKTFVDVAVDLAFSRISYETTPFGVSVVLEDPLEAKSKLFGEIRSNCPEVVVKFLDGRSCRIDQRLELDFELSPRDDRCVLDIIIPKYLEIEDLLDIPTAPRHIVDYLEDVPPITKRILLREKGEDLAEYIRVLTRRVDELEYTVMKLIDEVKLLRSQT